MIDMEAIESRGFVPGDLFHYPRHKAWGVLINQRWDPNSLKNVWTYSLTSPTCDDPMGPVYNSVQKEEEERFFKAIATGQLLFYPINENKGQ